MERRFVPNPLSRYMGIHLQEEYNPSESDSSTVADPIMMMTSRHRVQWGHHRHHCLRPSDLHTVSHSQIRRRLPNARQREATERWKLQGRQDFSRNVNTTHSEINHVCLIRCGTSCRRNTRQTNFGQSWKKFCQRREHRPWKTFKGSLLPG